MSITAVNLRLATSEESQHAKGNIVYRALNIPIELVQRALGTWEIYAKGANTLAWKTPALTSLIYRVKWLTGYAPEWPFIRHFHTFIGTWHYVDADPKMLNEVLSKHRIGEMLESTRSMKTMFEMISAAYPTITKNDLIFTCSPDKSKIYRNLLHRMMKSADYQPLIDEEVGATLNDWAERSENGEKINATIETRLLSSRIINRFLLGGLPSSDEKLSSSVNFMNYYILKKITRTLTEKDEYDFAVAIETFKEAVAEVIARSDVPLFAEQENVLTLEQKQGMIFTLFFAGQETVASLLTYILWQLGRDSSLTCDESLFYKSIKEFPPAYGIARLLKTDLCLEFEVEGDSITHKLVMFKGEFLSGRIIEVAKHEQEGNSYEAWKPFGAGVHRCPGEKLAFKEVLTFITHLQRYRIHTDQTEDLAKIGLVTTQLEKEIMITVTPR